MALPRSRFPLWLVLGVCLAAGGCNPLAPRVIAHHGYRVAPELMVRQVEAPQIERGERRPVIDAVGWVVGIPGKVLLWDPRVDNHLISVRTEAAMAEYLALNELDHVKVRLNQYRPWDDWRRLRANKTVGWGYRYTLGTLSVLGETIFPGRIFGGDHYNPFTATVHLYSDIPAIAYHEAAHAKDFSRRDYPGTYALLYLVPGAALWHEAVASRDVMAYVQGRGDRDRAREAYRILYPAYGTYVGGSLGYLFPRAGDPVYFGSILAGHAMGNWMAAQVPEETILPIRPPGIPPHQVEPPPWYPPRPTSSPPAPPALDEPEDVGPGRPESS
jgi:hypothetical protein